MQAPLNGDLWLGITEHPLPVGDVYEWAVLPRCGAVVLFSGVVRDHSLTADGTVRSGVQHLGYEAYEAQVVPKMQAIADELRQRWPQTGRLVLLHRIGHIELGASAVVVAVSAPHRHEAFEAARYGIDALKASVPIWKYEQWDSGADWGTAAQLPVDAGEVSA